MRSKNNKIPRGNIALLALAVAGAATAILSYASFDWSSYFKQSVPKKTLLKTSGKISEFFEIPCQSKPNLIFDQTIAPLDRIEHIVPSGAIASEEIKPHSYIDIDTKNGESVPLYAPADMELVQGAYYKEPQSFKIPATYILHFQISCEMALLLDHVTDPVEKIKALFPSKPQDGTRMGGSFGSRVKFKKGELIGYTKGGGDQSDKINRFDFGLYDVAHVNKFVNQTRYEKVKNWKSIHAVCPYDYFSKELKAGFYKKFATLNRVPVPGAACRSPNQDKAGTLSGAWFLRENSYPTEPHVGIGLELDGNSVILAGIPHPGEQYAIGRNEQTFKDPGEVKVGEEHCYFDRFHNTALYFKLISNTKAEVYTGRSISVCQSPFPSDNTFFLYR